MGWKENKKGGESRDNLKKKEEILQPPKLEVNASKKGEERKEPHHRENRDCGG